MIRTYLISVILFGVSVFAQEQSVSIKDLPLMTKKLEISQKITNLDLEPANRKVLLKTIREQVKIQQESDKLKGDSVTKQSMKMSLGNEGGHGGDPIALEFSLIGKLIAENFSFTESEVLSIYGFNTIDLLEVILKTRVVSSQKSEFKLNGEEVDAINFPTQFKIKINSDRWKTTSLNSKIRLVLHEYFGILGVERDHFDVSLELSSFVLQLEKLIRTDATISSLAINLFYGECRAVSDLASIGPSCNTSEKVVAARTCSLQQAKARCQANGGEKCAFVEMQEADVQSISQLGLRYCQILTIVK